MDTLVLPSRSAPLVLGRYRLLARLGAGGFGVVWRAYDESLRREVAVKQIHLPSGGDHERATREAQATARLSHPAIVALYEARAEDDVFYLVSELVHGQTLAVRISEGTLCDEEVLDIGLALSDALTHAHERGVIHRDVKPQNILIPEDVAEHGHGAKLTDFGGARLAGEEALTRTGDVLGTLAYMAPEQSEGREASAAADLYSLALVLYEVLCGANPVRGATPAATVRRIGSVLPSLGQYRRDLPRELTTALDVALAPVPGQRGTLAELHAALWDALEQGQDERAARPRRRAAPSLASAPPFETLQPWEAAPPRATRQLRPAAAMPARSTGSLDGDARPQQQSTRRLRLPRGIWLLLAIGTALWQVLAGRPSIGLLVCAAAAPLLLARRLSPGWLAAAAAPALGLAGLAGVFPALAGQVTGWRSRAAFAALGYWWLSLAEPLLAQRLWLGAPPGSGARDAAWQGSLSFTAMHVVGPLVSLGALFGAVLWGVGAALLPWLVRGRSALLDLLAAGIWTAVLFAAAPLLDYGLPLATGQPAPRGAAVAAILAAIVAVAARALRGPV